MRLLQDRYWSSWVSVSRPTVTDIPVSKAQLLGRAAEYIDKEYITRWISDIKTPTWRAVRDAHTGHSIHVVSDRSHDELTADLVLGLRLLAWMSAHTPVIWYWWDQPWPRLLPANTDPRQEHLNGGWAIPGVPEVHVYRREEAHKVLLHETIHALSLDVPQTLTDPVRLQFDAAFGRRLWPHLGEAFTELYAEWLWAIACPHVKTRKQAEARWAAQLVCSSKQAAQIWTRIRDSKKAEDTNVFAYYVLKWVLMEHLESVLLAPTASVDHWYEWWLAVVDRLEAMASAVASSESDTIKMGMTCQ